MPRFRSPSASIFRRLGLLVAVLFVVSLPVRGGDVVLAKWRIYNSGADDFPLEASAAVTGISTFYSVLTSSGLTPLNDHRAVWKGLPAEMSIDAYLEYTLTAAETGTVNVTAAKIGVATNGIADFQLEARTSADNFAKTVATQTFPKSDVASYQFFTIPIGQKLPASGKLKVRVYPSMAADTSLKMFGNYGPVDDGPFNLAMEFVGSVASKPTPTPTPRPKAEKFKVTGLVSGSSIVTKKSSAVIRGVSGPCDIVEWKFADEPVSEYRKTKLTKASWVVTVRPLKKGSNVIQLKGETTDTNKNSLVYKFNFIYR